MIPPIETSMIPSWPETATAEYVAAMVAEMNGRDGDFEGPLPDRIARYRSYSLERRPIASLGTLYDVSPFLVDEYASMDAETAPPLLFDPLDDELMDGYHRIRAAIKRGDADVICYVGNVDDMNPYWTPED